MHDESFNELRYAIKANACASAADLPVNDTSQSSDAPALVLKLRQYLIQINELLMPFDVKAEHKLPLSSKGLLNRP